MGGMEEMVEAYTLWVMGVYLHCFISDIKSISKQRKGLMGRERTCMGRGERISL